MSSSIRTTVHESLPYIDPEPTPAEREAAQSLIQAELSTSEPPAPPPPTTTHPSSSTTTTTYQPTFTPLITSELERISQKKPLKAVDLSRYEEQDQEEEEGRNPSTSTTTATSTSAEELEPRLARAYATSTYLTNRQTHLQLLDHLGKNAWLVGNWQLEAELQALERELAAARREADEVQAGRRRAQDDVAAEMRGLDEAWRRGVGRVLETEIAAEGLRQQVLARQRAGA
ncbi:Pre-mRNA-splicing factor SPF27 [Xylariomycetidae sp. FL2044]|nr:Pre-mRNA-splicing factor SPF27 [Xylariomycetidae sp. FL2044]